MHDLFCAGDDKAAMALDMVDQEQIKEMLEIQVMQSLVFWDNV